MSWSEAIFFVWGIGVGGCVRGVVSFFFRRRISSRVARHICGHVIFPIRSGTERRTISRV